MVLEEEGEESLRRASAPPSGCIGFVSFTLPFFSPPFPAAEFPLSAVDACSGGCGGGGGSTTTTSSSSMSSFRYLIVSSESSLDYVKLSGEHTIVQLHIHGLTFASELR